MAKSLGFPDWTSFPIEIRVLIAERLETFEDFIRFCLVCKPWQLVKPIILGKCRILPSKSPWVMLPDIAEQNYPIVTNYMMPYKMLVKEVEKNEYVEGMNKRRFFSFETSKTYDFELPEATRKKCYGVGYGWLLTVGYDFQINLLHPFTRQQISMPPLMSSFETHSQQSRDLNYNPKELVSYFIRKVVMSSNPQNEDCIVLAIYGISFRQMAFARPGDKVWTEIDANYRIFEDVVYYKEKFYAVSTDEVNVIDINDAKARLVTRLEISGRYYLVESSGSLLLVFRSFSGTKKEIFTSGFIIFELEECIPEESNDYFSFKVTQMDCLGDRSLFLGYNASVSVPSSKCVKANCIYFSEAEYLYYQRTPYGGGKDTGIYDVESDSVTLHYASEFTSHLTPPLWLI